ncbi:phage terminase small subunit [Melaminivora sp.]|uniref:phage terminase small subunit n=1 Tax=Melaminivora sp. TaxID=1933032 RepID=UPI0028A78122|nr:phage terminase small subunit [Melaminivora sp.]
MRLTPAQRHRMHHLALQQAALAEATNAHGHTVGTAYELQLAQLHQHRLRLKDLQSVERKVEAKRAMLPEYDAYLDGVLAARPGTQDDVLATVLVWHIDAGNYGRALQLAEYALASGMSPPDRYNRDLPTIVQDEVAEAILAGRLAGPDAVAIAAQALQLTEAADTPDQARAKLYKAAGWALLGKTGSHDVDMKTRTLKACKAALPLLQRALQLDTRTGVKKDIERLERRLAKLD